MRIVVPAHHAATTLPRCVRALRQGSGTADCPIYVVDDGENGDLKQVLAPYSVSIISSNQAHSAGKSRNHGAAGYDGDILVFVDADVEVDRHAIELLTEPIRASRAKATVGNYSTDTASLSFSQSYKQLYLSRVYSRRDAYIRNHFWTALCAIETSTFFTLNGFSRDIAGACEEDTELGHRMTQAGVPILAVPRATARHIKPHSVSSIVLNDLRKGMSTVPLFLRRDTRITDNRHASPIDIIAVALAGISVATLLAAASVHAALWALLAIALPLYLVARRDLLAYFARPGLWFLLRAVPLMWFLDLIRAVCVAAGVWTVAMARLRTTLRNRLRRSVSPALGARTPHG